MALIVEDGTGKSNADSYLSDADASTYHINFGSDAWAQEGSEPKREKALRQATQYLQAHFEGRWIGIRANELQSLAWPRNHAIDVDDFLISHIIVPQRVKDATAELAVRALAGPLQTDETTPGTIRRSRVKVDVIEKETEYNGASQQTLFRFVSELLASLLVSSGTMRRA